MVGDEDAFTLCIILGSTCTSQHLQYIQSTQLYPTSLACIIDLCSFNHYSVSWKVHTPGKCGSGHQHLNVPISKQIFHQVTIHSVHSSMMNSKAVGQ